MELPQNYNMLSSQERRLVRQEYVRVQKDLCSFCKGNLSQQPPDHIINKRINKRLFPEGFLITRFICITITIAGKQSVQYTHIVTQFCGSITDNKGAHGNEKRD